IAIAATSQQMAPIRNLPIPASDISAPLLHHDGRIIVEGGCLYRKGEEVGIILLQILYVLELLMDQ
ncbi:MAG: hypothetical protein OEW04_02545, partial [Nitrospirota bacterium]|nr:hypothetical protein [Nitrospirota bacterium]